MQARIALTLFTGNTFGSQTILMPTCRAQSCRSFFWYAVFAGTGCSRAA